MSEFQTKSFVRKSSKASAIQFDGSPGMAQFLSGLDPAVFSLGSDQNGNFNGKVHLNGVTFGISMASASDWILSEDGTGAWYILPDEIFKQIYSEEIVKPQEAAAA